MLLTLLSSGLLLLQEPEPSVPPAPEVPPVEVPEGQEPTPEGEAQDPPPEGEVQEETPEERTQRIMEEIQELIGEVREGFRAVDEELQGARSALDAPDPAAPPSEFHDRLGDSVDRADDLIADMEELLEKLPASDQQSQSSSSSSSSQQNQRPNSGQGDQKRDPKDGEGDLPEGNQQSDRPPTQSEDMSGDPLLSLRRMMLWDQGYGAWGFLPPRLQIAVENAAAEDLPLRYRSWLEEYHRRASRETGR